MAFPFWLLEVAIKLTFWLLVAVAVLAFIVLTFVLVTAPVWVYRQLKQREATA